MSKVIFVGWVVRTIVIVLLVSVLEIVVPTVVAHNLVKGVPLEGNETIA